jgi:hypothetical protein
MIWVQSVPGKMRSVTLFSTIRGKRKKPLGQRLSLYLCSEWGMAG